MKKLFLLLSISILLVYCKPASKHETYEFTEFMITEMGSDSEPVELPFSGVITINEQLNKIIAESYFSGTELMDMMVFDIISRTPKDSPYRMVKSVDPNASMWNVEFGVHKDGILMMTTLGYSATKAIMIVFPDSQAIFTFVLK